MSEIENGTYRIRVLQCGKTLGFRDTNRLEILDDLQHAGALGLWQEITVQKLPDSKAYSMYCRSRNLYATLGAGGLFTLTPQPPYNAGFLFEAVPSTSYYKIRWYSGGVASSSVLHPTQPFAVTGPVNLRPEALYGDPYQLWTFWRTDAPLIPSPIVPPKPPASGGPRDPKGDGTGLTAAEKLAIAAKAKQFLSTTCPAGLPAEPLTLLRGISNALDNKKLSFERTYGEQGVVATVLDTNVSGDQPWEIRPEANNKFRIISPSARVALSYPRASFENWPVIALKSWYWHSDNQVAQEAPDVQWEIKRVANDQNIFYFIVPDTGFVATRIAGDPMVRLKYADGSPEQQWKFDVTAR